MKKTTKRTHYGELLSDMISYAGGKLYRETPWWNIMEKMKWHAILKFLQQTYRNL